MFAGQRLDGFYVDLGSVFDLLDLRPFQNLHLLPSAAAAGVDGLRAYNVHTLAIQVPISDLTVDGSTPTDPMSATSVIGVWASASRQKALVRNPGGSRHVERPVGAGLAPRQPAGQRGAHPDDQEGPLELARPGRRLGRSPSTSTIRSWPG